ncbi:hypothetical protein AB0L41_24030 [Amycolatopsis mediterranei]|uniref:hypothetical protein n=1 Tax=Amycolatopsis mediterranei TaxID=33910 RepID=UPI003426F978
MSESPDLDEVIARYAAGPFTDSTLLTEAGVVSLSIFRIIAALRPDPDVEIDVESVACVRTVLDLKQWLRRHLADAGRVVR